MKSFLDHDRPDDEEDENARADAPTDTNPKSNSPPPPTKASQDVSPDSTSKGLVLGMEAVSPATASGSPSKDRAPSLCADTASSQAEASTSRASSSKAESSKPSSTVAAMASNSEATTTEKPKPKLKIRLLGPNAANAKNAASNGSRDAPIDVAKVRARLELTIVSHLRSANSVFCHIRLHLSAQAGHFESELFQHDLIHLEPRARALEMTTLRLGKMYLTVTL